MQKRTMEQIQAEASMWWPADIRDKASEAVNLPYLLDTQAEFLSLLVLAKRSPFKIFDLIETADFPANLFLKHLVILADFGGEPIKRLGKSFATIFPKDEAGHYFDFQWGSNIYQYRFESLPIKGLSNTKLSIDGAKQKDPIPLDGLIKDMIAILLFAGSSTVKHIAGLDICDIGKLLGHENDLMQYVKKKYLFVSRITGGTIANQLGQIAQRHVIHYLQNRLSQDFIVKNNGKIVLSGYKKKGGMPFDIVVDRGGDNQIGIEISFQVTTYSTIERKAGQAANRQNLLHNNGHHIAYVLDGAGNFDRWNAFTTIINHSDCTVAFSEPELEKLAMWIEQTL